MLFGHDFSLHVQLFLHQQVVISYDVNHPSSLAIIEDTIIWSEKKTGSIMAANKFTGKDRHRLVKLNNGLTGVIVLHPALQPDGRCQPSTSKCMFCILHFSLMVGVSQVHTAKCMFCILHFSLMVGVSQVHQSVCSVSCTSA